jgi:hypothetical protein
MRVSEDKLVATLELQGAYGAEELERLIADLSALRSQMLPAVPMTPGARFEGREEDPAAARAGGDPFVQVAVMREGVTRFWVRHCGLGWFGFNLPVDRARTLAQYILGIATPRETMAIRRRQSDTCH